MMILIYGTLGLNFLESVVPLQLIMSLSLYVAAWLHLCSNYIMYSPILLVRLRFLFYYQAVKNEFIL